MARAASAPPRASEPVSPRKICAGEVFHQRKPIERAGDGRRDDGEVERVAHVVALVHVVGVEPAAPQQLWLNCQKPMMTYEPIARIDAPVASPSRPSVTLTPFEVATVITQIQRMNRPMPTIGAERHEVERQMSRMKRDVRRRRREALLVRELQREHREDAGDDRPGRRPSPSRRGRGSAACASSGSRR